jgi:hypothetical protein
MPIVLDGGAGSPPPPPPPPPGSPSDFAFDAIYPYILPAAKSAAFALVDQAIVSSADQLLRRCQIWNVQLADVTPVADQAEYPLPLPAGAQCVKLRGWAQGGVRRRCITLDEATQLGLEPGNYVSGSIFFDGDSSGDGIPSYPLAYLLYENVVRVLPAPTDVAQLLSFSVQCTVMNGAQILPGVLFPYIRLVAYGALAILQSHPQKDYTDLKTAALNDARFNDGVAKLAFRVMRAFGAGTVRRAPRSY